MAVAGKVAITLSTENGGAWSADVTYDRLVAVKHNNNLYISRKTVANVEPPNDEFWFLALEGFGGDDVQALIDRMNELSDLIQAIIDGTTQVGNAKTLDGHDAEYFAPKDDLAKYLPLTGGTVATDGTTPLQLKNNTADVLYLQILGVSGVLGYFAMNGKDKPSFISTNGAVSDILHTGNKPTGTYTGNGDATERRINTGGIGSVCIITGNGMAIVYNSGAILVNSGTVTSVRGNEAKFENGVLILATTNATLNINASTLTYTIP